MCLSKVRNTFSFWHSLWTGHALAKTSWIKNKSIFWLLNWIKFKHKNIKSIFFRINPLSQHIIISWVYLLQHHVYFLYLLNSKITLSELSRIEPWSSSLISRLRRRHFLSDDLMWLLWLIWLNLNVCLIEINYFLSILCSRPICKKCDFEL